MRKRIASGYDWYEEQRRGLGTDFLEEVSFMIAAIESNPRRFQRVSRILRRARLRRFPYGIYFVDPTRSFLYPPSCILRVIRGSFIKECDETLKHSRCVTLIQRVASTTGLTLDWSPIYPEPKTPF